MSYTLMAVSFWFYNIKSKYIIIRFVHGISWFLKDMKCIINMKYPLLLFWIITHWIFYSFYFSWVTLNQKIFAYINTRVLAPFFALKLFSVLQMFNCLSSLARIISFDFQRRYSICTKRLFYVLYLDASMWLYILYFGTILQMEFEYVQYKNRRLLWFSIF